MSRVANNAADELSERTAEILREPDGPAVAVNRANAPNDGRPPAARLAAVGLVLLTIGVALGVAAAGERTLPAEIEVMQAVQRPVWVGFDAIAWAASRAGDALPTLLLISGLTAGFCWIRGRPDLALFVLAATALRALGPPLKWLFASPRPPAAAIAVVEQTDGFGYPSGHAFGAALVFGAIAFVLPEIVPNRLAGRVLQAAAIALIVLVGLSRVRLGVHWPSDVAGGLAFGLGLLCLLRAALLVYGGRALRM